MREKEKSTRLIFVRHGHTDFPTDRIYCDDREDPMLSTKGQNQAKNTANLLSSFDVAAIYSSPCQRTLMTAKDIASHHDVPILQRDTLRERHFGIWEGLYFHEIAERYPEEQRRWKEDNAGFKPQGGESVYDLHGRLTLLLGEVVEPYRGQTVVIVSHVGPIRVFISAAIGLPMTEYRCLIIDNASLTRVDYGIKQNNLQYLNLNRPSGLT